MAKFDEMLKQLHNPKGATLTDAEANEPIVINSLRQFEVPKGYNLTIAYEGDVNSQKITFKLPRYHENHDLYECDLKVIRWKNTSNKAEDISNLKEVDVSATDIIVEWLVPPAAFVAAGNIEIAITFYDVLNGSLAFSWNTAVFSGFRVEKTLSQVGKIPTNIAPAKNEILSINEETHSIVAPAGYNFTFSVYGSKNTAMIHFQAPAALGGMDMLDGDTTVSIIVKMGNIVDTDTISLSNIRSSFYNTQETGNGLVEFDWLVPDWVTYNGGGYTGTITITIIVENADETKIWKTTPFAKLILGKGDEDISGQTLSTDYHTIIDASSEQRPARNKTISGIVSFKQMTEEEWKIESDYKPHANEMIIYAADADHTSPRIKFGNGNSLAKDLPFVIDPTVPDWARAETFEYTLTQDNIQQIISALLVELPIAEELER